MISLSLVKKWKNMLLHKSVLHVNQTEGLFYSTEELRGYYNNLTDKVVYTSLLDEKGIPMNDASLGEKRKKVYFPITIFQYGLGAYDLYLKTADASYLEKAKAAADWALEHQLADGAWDAFGIFQYSCPWSSMAQGEGASLLVRIWKETKKEKYLKAAELAAEFMLLPVEQGGTAVYARNTAYSDTGSAAADSSEGMQSYRMDQKIESLTLLEYPDDPCVLNGWMFSAFGLYDLWLATGREDYLRLWKAASRGIRGSLKDFDTGHWSYYDLGGKYTSPFYHSLHIEMLKAMQKLDPDPVFEAYIQKWSRCRNHWFWKRIAFFRKALQKLTEKKGERWVITG